MTSGAQMFMKNGSFPSTPKSFKKARTKQRKHLSFAFLLRTGSRVEERGATYTGIMAREGNSCFALPSRNTSSLFVALNLLLILEGMLLSHLLKSIFE